MFRKRGKIGNVSFKYKCQAMEAVNEYTYLGVLFTSSGLFFKTAKMMKQKGLAAMSSAWNIFTAEKISSFMSKCRIFDSLAASVPLYARCHSIWGLSMGHDACIVKIHHQILLCRSVRCRFFN